MLQFIGNILWFVLGGGLFSGLAWLFFGVLLCCTVIGIPAGIASFRIARFAFFPFGKELVRAEELGEKRILGTGLINFLWILLAGLWISLGHILWGVSCFVSCILIFPILFGAPVWGMAHFKLAQAAFAPLGKRIVPTDIAKAARARYVNKTLDQKLGGQSNNVSVTVSLPVDRQGI